MSTIYLPYTYLIGWSKLNLWYYGAKYGRNNSNPDLFWNTNHKAGYFTSSSEVSVARELLGEPDIIEIRRTFKTREACTSWEKKVLRRMGVLRNTKWLNRNEAGAVVMTPDIAKKIGDANRGRFKNKTYEEIYGPDEAVRLRKLRSSSMLGRNNQGNRNPFFGKHRSSAEKDHLSNCRKAERGKYIWLCHPELGTTKALKSNLEKYLSSGWQKGRKLSS